MSQSYRGEVSGGLRLARLCADANQRLFRAPAMRFVHCNDSLTIFVHCNIRSATGEFSSRKQTPMEHHIMNTSFEDMQKTAKDNMDAATKAFGSFTKNAQTVSTEAADFAKKSYEANAAHVEKLFAVKTLDKAIELNTEFAKSAYEGFVAQATKMSTLYTDFAKDAMKPVEAAFAKAKTVVAK
jgi:hypothetical protein